MQDKMSPAASFWLILQNIDIFCSLLSELNGTETMLGAVAKGIEHVHKYKL